MARRSVSWPLVLVLGGLLPFVTQAGRQMPKLADKKLCADAECSHPILIARALQDYYPQDCRFIPIRQGQLVYVYAMLKDRGNLFWAGSVQGSYYGEQEARLGHFPSSIVEETHALMPAEVVVNTDCNGALWNSGTLRFRMESRPPFYYMLRASGQGEVWHDSTDEAKFQQFGWRCSTGEDLYSPHTLLGNWAEERFDTRSTASRRPLLSQFSHYFETTYSTTYNKEDKRPLYSTLKREARSFPGHQPELDPPHTQRVPNSSYRLDFSRAPGLWPTVGKQPGTESSSSDLHQTVNGT